MKFGYTVLYVPHLENALSFYEKAFGLTRKFVAEGGFYRELDTGETTLSFCEEDRLTSEGMLFHPSRPEAAPPAMEIAFVTSEVEEKYQQAIAAGATPVRAPKEAP